jgi:hypothetical protein
MTTDNATAGQVGLTTTPDKLPREAPPHSRKFRAALATLAGIAVGAIAVAVVFIANDNSASAPKAGHWSSWAPSSSGSAAVKEIVSHVAPLYKLNSSHLLDVVTPLNVSQATSSGTVTGNGLTVVVNTGGSSSQSLELLTGNTVVYTICGLGSAGTCELPGKATTTRMLLMRREALELALYTFKYDSGSQNVVAVLPPGHTTGSTIKPVTVSVLFVRKELQPQLDEPLSKSLEENPPSTTQLPAWSQTSEAALVGEITGRGLFASQVETQQTVGKLLVLSPITS